MPMRAFNDQTGWETAYDDTVFTVEALTADDNVAPIAKALDGLLTQWDAIEVDRRKARRGVVRGHARVRLSDVRLDEVIGKIADELVSVVGRKGFSHPLYKRLFPTPPSAVMAMALEAEVKAVRVLMGILADKETPAAIRDAGKPLAERVASADKALAERGKAEAEAEKVSARIGKWKREANAQRLGVQGKLLDQAAKAGSAKSYADRYFPASAGKAKGKAHAKPEEAPKAKTEPKPQPKTEG